MKKILLSATIFLLGIVCLFAQLPPGSIAPDWTKTDLDGVSHHLYDYLDDEKVVFLDFSATWCGPCWNYHNSNAFKNVYASHAANVIPFMIEGDANTNNACLYGPTGCNNSTWGNWVNGTTYPIIEASDLTSLYAISYWPTIYGICPDKKIYEVGQVGAGALWDFAKDCSAPTMQVLSQVNVDCFGGQTGAVTLSIEGGISPFSFEWNNGATTQNLSNVAAGTYSVTVTGSLGGTKSLGPIIISEPVSPLQTTTSSVVSAGCGFGGSIILSTNGGTPNYAYAWNTGQTEQAIFNLDPGTYSVTTTDLNGCTTELQNIVIAPPAIPVAAATAPAPIDCDNVSMFLDGNGSTIDPNVIYAWVTGDGNIVSGATTLNNCLINAPGTYQLFVTNTVSNCVETAEAIVIANTQEPDANASAPNALDCTTTSTLMSGLGSAVGAQIEYLWTTTDGNIVSGATTLAPTVDETGTYTLIVTDNSNGCTSDASAMLTSDTTPPNASATGGELTCIANAVEIAGQSTTPNVSYEWSGPANFSSTEQNVEVEDAGIYTLTVTDPENGCTETTTAEVATNTTLPDATADGGTIDCLTSTVTLDGNSNTSGVTYAWTGPNGFTSSEQHPEVEETGNYLLTVTGSNGCTETDNASVDENTTVPTADAGVNGALNCNSSSIVLNGSASSGGNQYSYSWTTTNGNIVAGANSLTPTVDAEGDYILLVTNNNNGCENTDETIVTTTPPVAASIVSQTNIACFGNATGAASVEASGGNGTYTYAWSNGATGASLANLSAGTYTVIVTDADDCTASEVVTITEPLELNLTTNSTAQTAPGVNDGTASAIPTGGTGTYSYAWSNGGTTATITGLAPGTYIVDVTDDNGCTETQTVTVNEFGCALSANTMGDDISCFGAADGMAMIELGNAAQPFTFAWSNGETTAAIENLEPGNYTVTASDNNGCEIVTSYEIEQPGQLNPNATSTGVTAAGAEDGTATANPTGGTGPFTYQWSNGETTEQITGLASANYTVIVTDVNGCSSEQIIPVAPFACSIASNITANNIQCFGENNGQATVTLSNGLSPFTYEWSNGEITPTINNLAPGTYTVEVVDAVNCPTITEVTIIEPTALEAEITLLANADCGASNGSASVEATGGNGDYTYEWSNGETSALVTGLDAGTYTVFVTDENQCMTTMEIQIAVDDVIDPIALTQDITIMINDDGMASITPADIDNGSSDNCDIDEMTLDVSSFDCSHLGSQEVTLTVKDAAGNSQSATAQVMVVDNISPQIEVQNLTINLDENGEASITAAEVDGGSTDNCAIQEMDIDISSFNCENIGANAVVLSVKDASGNTSSGTAIVTVVDNIAPVTECPADINLPYCNPIGEYSVSAVDNCSDDLVYQWPADYPSGSTFPTGTTELEVIVSDANGNSSTCQFNVRVPDAMAVEGDVTAISCNGESDGSIAAQVVGGTEGYTYEWSTGETTAEITNLPIGNYNVVVTDAEGCTEMQNFNIAEPDILSAEVENLSNETLNNMNGAIDITPVGGVGGYSFNWTDENGNFISNEEDISGLSAGNYNVVITDENGCAAQQTFTIQTVVSLIDHEMARKVKLYPNPTTGFVTLELEDLDAVTADITVFDVTGQSFLNQINVDIRQNRYQFDLSGAATGIYIVRLVINNSVVTKRLIVSQ